MLNALFEFDGCKFNAGSVLGPVVDIGLSPIEVFEPGVIGCCGPDDDGVIVVGAVVAVEEFDGDAP